MTLHTWKMVRRLAERLWLATLLLSAAYGGFWLGQITTVNAYAGRVSGLTAQVELLEAICGVPQ